VILPAPSGPEAAGKRSANVNSDFIGEPESIEVNCIDTANEIL
jgi:hypothetical protein